MVRERFDSLNTLRVVALFMVVFLHATCFDGKNFPASALMQDGGMNWIFFTPAWGGVWIFFILSGFLAGKGFAEGRYTFSRKSVLAYYKKKVLRVYLPTMLFIGFCVVLFNPSFFSKNDILLKMLTSTWDGTAGFPGPGATWYVFTLMWFYAFAPLLCFLAGKLQTKGCIIACSVVVMLLGLCERGWQYRHGLDWYTVTYTPPYSNFDLFFVGVLMAYLCRCAGKSESVRMGWKTAIAVSLAVLIVANTYFFAHAVFVNVYRYGLPSVYLVLVAAYLYVYQTSADCPAGGGQMSLLVNHIDRISFEFYLFHSLIFWRIAPHIGGHTPLGQYAKYLLVGLMISYVFARGWHCVISGMRKERRG